MLKLQFVDRRQPAMWLVDSRLTIGRDKANGLVINDEGVSVFHAELRQEDNKLFLWDSGSVNGTFLNGEKVVGKVEVKVGDVIRLYLVELEIIDPSKSPAELPQAVKRDFDKPVLPQWQLKAMTGTISGKMYLIDGTKIIGRDPGCDIVVTGAHVSRRHAEISLRGGQLWVKDLGSSNGSFINGKRSEETSLKNGDEVKLDAMTFRVVGPAEIEESFDEADQTQFRPIIAPALKPAPQPAAASASQPTPRPLPTAAQSAATQPAPAMQQQPAPRPQPVVRPVETAAPAPAAKSGNTGLIVVLGLLVVGLLLAAVLF